MTIKALVMSDRPDEYTGKKGLIKQQIITVMDLSDTGERLAQPIEYALRPAHTGRKRRGRGHSALPRLRHICHL